MPPVGPVTGWLSRRLTRVAASASGAPRLTPRRGSTCGSGVGGSANQVAEPGRAVPGSDDVDATVAATRRIAAASPWSRVGRSPRALAGTVRPCHGR